MIGIDLRVKRDATIFGEGDLPEYCYRLVSGMVRLCKHMPDGRRQISQFLHPGDFFGFDDCGEHSFTAEAVCDAGLTSYPQRKVMQLSDETPAVRSMLLKVLSQNVSELQRHLVVLGRQSARERVASFLLLLSERVPSEEEKVLNLSMSRRDIADYLGLTVETVSRTISELKRRRVIEEGTASQMRLREMGTLHALAGGEE